MDKWPWIVLYYSQQIAMFRIPMNHYDLSSLLQWLHERDILSPCFYAGARPPLRYQSFVAV